MEAIGRPLPPVPTQWLEPVEEVRTRWLGMIAGVVEQPDGDLPADLGPAGPPVAE